ncbi:hypothetical protein MN2019_21100 [Mycolicibacterium neoaurum]|uniref:hypothetical protein n=1 Tax=Mycolicibacterium neoaurum TaxID=1795 RepID=UPI001BCF66F0|nr:hypothetical protein [Mycolicibacterium neoaurum]QVI26746.1 hypothetical protein MN2019_21100 [Mycolicibacterium neoaurum]
MARPRADLTYARPRPVETIAIDVTPTGRGYRCIAVGETWSRSSVLAAPNAEVAALFGDSCDPQCDLAVGI